VKFQLNIKIVIYIIISGSDNRLIAFILCAHE
jgi:hypothetical protein